MLDILPAMLDFLPADKPYAESLDSLMSYLDELKAPVVTEWKHIIFKPDPNRVVHHLFYFNDKQDSFICFLVYKGATFVPDWISKILQLYGGYHLAEDASNLYPIVELIDKFITLFARLCQWRLVLTMWLIFNPYTFPWIILVEMTEWFLEGWSGIFPTFFGVELSGMIVLAILGEICKYLRNLVFTMPYLPSERVKETIGRHTVYRFSGFPRLWSEYGIPDELRERWYDQQPEITEHFLKYYGDIGQDILPTRIIEEYYNEYIKNATITTSLTNFNHFLTTDISSLNDVLDIDILTNQMITVYEKLIHNF